MLKRNTRTGESGFNLVEVLIAMAILGSVMISIITLFFLGRRNVYSGKIMTQAMSVAVHANEDIQAMGARDLFKSFGPITSSTTAGANTVAGVSYAKSIVFTTQQAGTAADVNRYLNRWAKLLPQARLQSGVLSVVIIPLDQTISTDVTTARVVQVRLVAEWSEATRKRSAVVDSSILNRF